MIPAKNLKAVLNSYHKAGGTTTLHRGLLGVRLYSEYSDKSGVVVEKLTENSPAGEEGLQPNDEILELNERPIASNLDLILHLQEYRAGDEV